ncbi:hypothetical protein Daus18300_011967 [Diaporthe australafricana]|uniref:Uncharacterized protein n=1 Tax=Diaporthe australafricana TaxID=127596 RepID=A0ABR3W517_9PEZI
MDETIEVFKEVATFFITLLNNGKKTMKAHLTPLSYLCAHLSKQYKGSPGFMVVSYFCGLHADVGGKDVDAQSMLTSLIGQILSEPDMKRYYDPESFDKHIVKKVKKKDIESLGKIFRILIDHLRATSMVVFCLIDSISFYEVAGRNKDAQTALSILNRIVASQRGRRRRESDKMVFKLIVTAGAKSLNAYKCFKPKEVLEMNESVDGETTLKFN